MAEDFPNHAVFLFSGNFLKAKTRKGQPECAEAAQFQAAVVLGTGGEANSEGILTDGRTVVLAVQEGCTVDTVLDHASHIAAETEVGLILEIILYLCSRHKCSTAPVLIIPGRSLER